MKEREIYGVKVFVSGEDYDDYKGTLEEQLEEKDKEIERLNNTIKEVREYIKENMSYIEKGNLEYIPSGKELLEILDKEKDNEDYRFTK